MIDLVPWPDRFYVEPPKLDAYLLDPASDDGVSKGRYLLSDGFDAARPAELRDALMAHATAANFVGMRVTSFGLKFNVDGPLPAPNGREATVLTVWMIDAHREDGGARFITTRPSGGKRRRTRQT